jgi:hypothetical protein
LPSSPPPDSSDRAECRNILISQRLSDPSYKSPSEQKRRVFRSKEKNESLSNPETWEFSFHEIGKAIATWFEAASLERIGIIQALLQLRRTASVEDLWQHALDSKLEKRRQERKKAIPRIPFPWLRQATIRNSIDLVILLSSGGCEQASLDESLGLALYHRHIKVARELLRYGASLDSHQKYLFDSVRKADLDMIKLWLLAPSASQKHLDKAMCFAIEVDENVENQEELLSLLLGNVSISSELAHILLLGAIEAQNPKSVAALLMVTLKEEWRLFVDCSKEVIEGIETSTIKIPDACCRREILDLIISAGMRADSLALRAELFRSVRDGDIELAKVLIVHGTRQDSGDEAALNWAVENASLDALEAFRSASISANAASRAMDRIPAKFGESEQMKMVELLIQKGASGPPLARHLLRTLEWGQSAVIEKLLLQGAAIDFEDAAAVRLVLEAHDLTLLERMLNLDRDCSPVALCHALPDAMSIPSKEECFRAVSLLLTKGVEGDKLHIALLDAVKRTGESRDVDLIQLLTKHRASVNYSIDGENCIHDAAKRVDVEVLRYLCAARPSPDIVLGAIPLAFGSLGEKNEGQVLKVLSTLLQTRPKGDTIGSTLVQAIAAGRLQIANILLQHSISQHHFAQAVQEALKLDSLEALELLCKVSIPKQVLQKYVHEVLHGGRYNRERARLLLEASRAHNSVLDQSLGSEELREHSHRHEIIEMLLAYGANVNVNNGAIVRFAVQVGDVELAKLLFSSISISSPNKSTLAKAFKASTELSQKHLRLQMMRLLLKAARSDDIGQNEALIQESREAPTTDSAIVELLLQHNASVDFDSGAALKEAVISQSIPLLKLLLTKEVSANSLSAPFSAARAMKFPDDCRFAIFKILLEAGHGPHGKSDALVEALGRDPQALETPRLLLQHGASVKGAALASASIAGSLEMLDLLMSHCPTSSSVETAFLAARMATLDENTRLSVFQRLLPGQLKSETLSQALIESVKRNPKLLDIPTLLLKHGAPVDFECFAIAAKNDDISLLKLLLTQRVDFNTLLNRWITLGMEEDKLLRLLGVASDQLSTQAKIENKFVLINAVMAYPAASSLVAFLLRHGCSAESTFQNPLAQETTTALIWALDEEPGRGRVCDSVILMLLSAASKAYVDFVTEESRASAIIHTVKSGRISVLERLVALDADLSVRDANEWTPLCHASRNRDEKAVAILVQAGAAINDSSLHLAAKMAYPNIVSILLSAGHHPRYPSVAHNGRIPLACLCLESHGTGRDWELRLQQTLGLLAPLTDLKWRNNNKSLLHFALDNDHNACEVTMRFIEVSGLWESSNLNDEYMFTDQRELFYSPTQYVKLLCCSKEAIEKYLLIELLKDFGFTDRYYAELGNQPEGAVGFPPDIQAQRKAEWEKEEVIRRQNEIAAHNKRLSDETHREALRNQREQAAHVRKLELEKHEEQLKLQKERSDLAIELESMKLLKVKNSLAESYERMENLEERVAISMEQLKRVLNRAKEQERSLQFSLQKELQ